MKKIDLHIHTTSSDGTYSPKQLVDYAIEKHLSAVAITDHDTMRGIQGAIDYIKDNKIDLELIPGMEISSSDRNYPYGVHILAYFVEKNEKETKEILKNVEVELRQSSSTPKEVISIVAKHGGLTSLAHPQEYGLSIKKLDTMVGELAEYGLNGVEGFYTTHSDNYTEDIEKIVKKYNLGGTDFHGARKPGVDLGSGFGDLEIPYRIVSSLKSIKVAS